MNLNYPDLDSPFGYSVDNLFPEEAAAQRKRDEYRPSRTQIISGRPGDWRYTSVGRGKALVIGSMMFSAAFHGFLLFGTTGHLKKAAPRETTIEVALIEMPKIKELDEIVDDPADASQAPTGMDAPMLPDIPPTVVIDGSFTQTIDMSTFLEKPKLVGAQLSIIPTVVKRGGVGGAGKLREIFDLASLDRVPTAIMQAMPIVPPNLNRRDTPVVMEIQFVVTSRGEVVDVLILQSDASEYNDIATTAIMKWKFKPGIKNGRAVNSRMRQPMTFRFNSL